MPAKIITPKNNTPGEELLEMLGIQADRPVVVFMGGAAKLKPQDATNLETQLFDGLAKAIVEVNANVVDGGSDAGTMGILNNGLKAKGFSGNYIGVTPAALSYLTFAPSPNPLAVLTGAPDLSCLSRSLIICWLCKSLWPSCFLSTSSFSRLP